jgi:K+-transporting ATPase, c chain
MVNELRRAIFSSSPLTPITGLLHPVAITGVAQVLFPFQANGSLIIKDGNVVGSEPIGQLSSSPVPTTFTGGLARNPIPETQAKTSVRPTMPPIRREPILLPQTRP